jgi:hypothetical protein
MGGYMLRILTIGAIGAITALIGPPATRAQSYTWGVFRENVTNVPEDQRNCWVQAMVTGGAVNGEILAERLTQEQAEFSLQRETHHGRCANQRSSTSWSARGENNSGSDWSGGNWSNPNWSNPN